MMRHIILMLLTGCCYCAVAQQIVDNKMSVQLTGGLTYALGSKQVKEGSYESPSLINNFRQSFSMGLEVTYKIRRPWSLGLEIAAASFQSWANNRSGRYDGASYFLFSVNPKFQINTPFRESGLWNHVQAYVNLGPAIGVHSVHLEKPPYGAPSGEYDFKNSTFLAPGVTLCLGARLNVSQRIQIGASVGVSHFWVSSVLFDDSSVAFSTLAAQIGYKLGHNRRFKYAP